MRSRPAPPGFSLLELLVTISVAGILLMISVPSVKGLGARAGLTLVGHQVASTLLAARERAIARGNCTVVDLASTSTLRVREAPLRDCEKAPAAMALALTTPNMNVRTDAAHAVSFYLNTNNAVPEAVWRPTGYLRSDDYGGAALTLQPDDQDVWRLDIVDRRLPANRNTLQVVVKPMGMSCVVFAARNTKGECP